MIKILFPIFLTMYFIINSSFFIVPEGNKYIILRFNKPIKNNFNVLLYKPGLHIKIPFIDKIKKINSKIQTTKSTLNNFFTIDNNNILIDFYIKWKIINFNNYYISTKNINLSKIDFFLKNNLCKNLFLNIKKNKIKNILKYNNSFFKKKILNKIFKKKIFIKNLKKLGIKIIDFRIKKIYFSKKNYKILFNKINFRLKMKSIFYINQGKKENKKIIFLAKKKSKSILKETKKKIYYLNNKTEKKLYEINNYAIKKNKKLYIFLKKINSIKNSFKKEKNTIIVIIEKNFLHLFK